MASAQAAITMTMREADRLKSIQAVVYWMMREGQTAKPHVRSPSHFERLVDRSRDRPADLNAARPTPSDDTDGCAGDPAGPSPPRRADWAYWSPSSNFSR